MKTLLDLAVRVEDMQENISKAAHELKIEIARAVHRDLVYVTPVDTSQALSNWVLTTEEPWNLFIDPHVEGFQGSSQRASAEFALEAGEQQIKLSRPGESLFISNNAPYIVKLNEGSSQQAPAGFVERSILIGRKIMQKGLGLHHG